MNNLKIDQIDNMSNADFNGKEDKAIQNVLTAVTSNARNLPDQKSNLAIHVEKLNAIHGNVMKRMFMSKDDKETVRKYQESESKGVTILMNQRNQTFEILAKASIIHTKQFVDKVLQVSGINVENFIGLHFKQIQNKFIDKVEELNYDFLDMIEKKEKDMQGRSEGVQKMIMMQSNLLKEQYYKDYEYLVTQFSATIRTAV